MDTNETSSITNTASSITNTPTSLMQNMTSVAASVETTIINSQAAVQTPTISAPTITTPAPNLTNPTPTLNASLPQYQIPPSVQSGTSKYNQLLSMIDELGKDIRPTYNANRNCSDRLKRSIQHARGLVRECMVELEKNAK